MFNSNKAVSPLIAAVLLIVVTVGIGAVVVGIVRGFVTENKNVMDNQVDSMACSRDVVVEIVKIDGTAQICQGSNYINTVIENTGKVALNDFQMTVMGSSGFFTNDSLNSSMLFAPGQAKEFNITFSAASVGEVLQVKFVPKIKKKGGAQFFYCSDVAVKYEGMQDC